MPGSRSLVILCMYKGLPNYNKYTKDFPVQSELRKKARGIELTTSYTTVYFYQAKYER